MTEERTTKPEEEIKDLAKKGKQLTNDELGGVAGGVVGGGVLSGVLREEPLPPDSSINREAQTDGKWSPSG
jgi:hypothetical protein